MGIDGQAALYLGGIALLLLLIVGLAWRRGRGDATTLVSPVSGQWLAEWKNRQTPE